MTKERLVRVRNLSIINLIVFLVTLTVNYLGSSGFFNGMDQTDISDKYMTLISPAGFTFSIWGVIYSFLLATLIYLFIRRKNERVGLLIQSISPLFIASSLFNIGWMVAFSYELLGLSTILILAMLFSLMLIIEKIYKNRTKFPSTLAGITFTLYSSWVLIASIVNISLFLVQQGWGGFGISDSIWTIIILFIAIAFVVFYLTLYKNALFPLPIAWAFWGIYGSYSSGRLMPDMVSTIQTVLILGIILLVFLSGLTFIRNKNSIFQR